MNLALRLKESILDGTCAVCGEETINQFNVHYHTNNDFHPAGFTCSNDSCYEQVEASRAPSGALPS